MAYSSAEGRQELLDALAEAIDEIGYALASLGAAYEQLDEISADRLEEQLFQPAQKAYGSARRTQAEFAARHGLESRQPQPQQAGGPSVRARGHIESAVEASGAADSALAAVQDMPSLIEVGDVELRSGLSEVRELVGVLRPRARELMRTLGR